MNGSLTQVGTAAAPLRSSRYDALAVWLVLAICLGATWALWQAAGRDVADKQRNAFVNRTLDIEQTLEHQLDLLDSTLYGAAGLFAASDAVTRAAWDNYTHGLKLDSFRGAIRTLGYGEHVAAQARHAHVQKARSEGFASYAIRPEGERSEYVPVRFNTYFIETQATSHGFDMASEPRRRAAIFMARDTGKTAITKSLAPVIDPARRDSIVIMYHPVYQFGASLASVSERRAAIRGYVFAAIDLGKLFDTTLNENMPGIRMAVLDGADAATADRLYDSAPLHAASGASAMIQASRVEIGGKTWTLQFGALPQFNAALDHDKPGIVLAAGLLVSVLLFVITWFLTNGRRNALALANRMTAALREQEAFSRSVVDTVVDAIIVIDEHAVIQSFNQAAERIFGYTAAEVIGKNVRMLMPSPDRELHDGYVARYLTTGEKKIIGIGREVTGLRKGGETFAMELAISEIVRHGRRTFTGIVRDITERKRTEQAIINLNKNLLKRTEALTAANQELEAFSSSVSHDLRAPLRHIAGYIEMVMEDAGTLDEQTRRRLEIIAASAGRMGTMIDDLLSFSRLGRSEVRKQDVDLTALANQVISDLQSDHEGREIFWKVCDIPAVWGDPALLKFVLTNLISNAIKYTGGNSLTTIKIGMITGNGNGDGKDSTTIFVEDNGAGFDMAYADRLFRVFQRLHSTAEFEGTGIGLANVHRIISRHGGRVWAKSSPGEGATFYFSLPNKPNVTADERR